MTNLKDAALSTLGKTEVDKLDLRHSFSEKLFRQVDKEREMTIGIQ
jgi:hypothetical protein